MEKVQNNRKIISFSLIAILIILAVFGANIIINAASGSQIKDSSKGLMSTNNKVTTDILKSLKTTPPTISTDGKSVILPKSPDSKYEIALYGTSNAQVIDLLGNIYIPINDTTVELMYKVVTAANKDVIVEKGNFTVKLDITGSQTQTDNDNKKPDVLPALREWKGSNGSFKVNNKTKIVYDNNDIKEKAILIKDFIKDMAGISLEVSEGKSANAGDIFLSLDGNLSELGSEGYYIEITDKVIITAADEIGVLYGGVSITQILSNNKNTLEIPCGIARDYPAYPIRSGMIDVARAWIPLEHVEEITRYFAYYKLNEIHLHINDRGANNYAGFRLESNVKGLASTDGFYTKDAYRQYQKDVKKLGITVITEIDTPAHSYAFSKITPSIPMIDDGHLDISKRETIEFVKTLFDEYMTGDDPVFVDKKVHIGMDEYPDGFNELMRAYIDEMINYANSRGYTPRFWGSFGNKGFNGTTPVSGDAEVNYWAVELSDYKTLYEYGYDVINTCGPLLYVVPGGNYGFADYLDIKSLYTSWNVNTLYYDWVMPLGHPQTVGGSFALWNDLYTDGGGFSPYDIFDRLKGAVALMAEKTWCGDQTKSIPTEDFLRRVDLFIDKAPLTNPGKFYAGDKDNVVDINTVEKAVGFPYTIEFDVDFPVELGEELILFEGEDGMLVANINKSGKVGFRRGTYTFTFDYKIPQGEKVRLSLTGNNRETVLIINDTFFYKAINSTTAPKQFSSTFIFPLEKISDKVSDIKIVSKDIELNERKANNNLAFGKDVTVSGLEVDDGRFTPNMALDGDESTRLSFARDKHEQWLIVDLGEIRDVNNIEILFFEHVPEYKVFLSETGEDDDWTEVYHLTDGEEGTKQLDTIKFDTTKARYVKYQQLKMHYVEAFSTYYSGGILEFRVSGFDVEKYNATIKKAEDLISENGTFSGEVAGMKSAVAELKKYLTKDDIYLSHVEGLNENLNSEIEAFENPDSSHDDISEEDESKSGNDEKPSLWTSPWLLSAIIVTIVGGIAAAVALGRKKK